MKNSASALLVSIAAACLLTGGNRELCIHKNVKYYYVINVCVCVCVFGVRAYTICICDIHE